MALRDAETAAEFFRADRDVSSVFGFETEAKEYACGVAETLAVRQEKYRLQCAYACRPPKPRIVVVGPEATVAAGSFQMASDLVAVDMRSSKLDWVPEDCFCYCENLELVELPPTMREIGNSAFRGCVKLTSIDMYLVEVLGESAFAGCYRLRELPNAWWLRVVGEECFAVSGLRRFASGLRAVDIGACAFALSAVEDVRIPHAIALGFGAFFQCRQLATFRAACDEVGVEALCGAPLDKLGYFGGMAEARQFLNVALRSCAGEWTVECENVGAFGLAEAKRTFHFVREVEPPVVRFGGRSPGRCVQFGDAASAPQPGRDSRQGRPWLVKYVGEFSASKTLFEVYGGWLREADLSGLQPPLPAGADLRGFLWLERVVLPAGLEAIPGEFFFDCPSLASVNLGELSRLSRIGADAFYGCWSLRELDFPRGVRSIGVDAFTRCGLEAFDLGHLPQLDRFVVNDVPYLSRVILPRRCDSVSIGGARCICELTFGARGFALGCSILSLRYTELRGGIAPPGFEASGFRLPFILSELSSLEGSPGRPFLPI